MSGPETVLAPFLEMLRVGESAQQRTKQMTLSSDHDVVVVAIADSEHKGRHAVASTRDAERLLCPSEVGVRLALRTEPLGESVLVQHGLGAASGFVDIGRRLGVQNDFDHANLIASSDTAVRIQQQVQSCILPNLHPSSSLLAVALPTDKTRRDETRRDETRERERERERERDLVHNANHLKGQQILTKIISSLEDHQDRFSERIGVLPNQPQRKLLRVHAFTAFDNEPTSFHSTSGSSREGEHDRRRL